MVNRIKLLTILLLLGGITNPTFAQFGGLKKWFNKEVIPTITGERPLKIDPTRVRVSHNGKDIIRASTEGNGSIYVDLGVAKVQTSDLKTRLAQTAAIFSGNTAVMSQVAFEQFQKLNEQALKKAEEEELITISKTPPPNPYSSEQGEGSTPREVIIYNHTTSKLAYAINGYFYELEPETGYKHTSNSGEFFLQFDDDPTDEANVARYYLTGSEYSLYLYQGMSNIGIYRY